MPQELHTITYGVLFPIADTISWNSAEYLGEDLAVPPRGVVPKRYGDVREWVGDNLVLPYTGLILVQMRRRMHKRGDRFARALTVLRRHQTEVLCEDGQDGQSEQESRCGMEITSVELSAQSCSKSRCHVGLAIHGTLKHVLVFDY